MTRRDPLHLLRTAIQEVALADPDRIALKDGHQTRTYGELAMSLDAGSPREQEGRRGVACVTGCLSDVELLLRDSSAGSSLLVLDAGATRWEVDRARSIFLAGSLRDPTEPILGLCSSGSNGLPKVVELDWESLLLNAQSFAHAAGYAATDVVWCTTPLAHLYGLGAGVLGTLLSGATVLLSTGMLEPLEFEERVLADGVTYVLSVPFLFRRYLENLTQSPQLVRSWRVRCCIAAGESVSPELIVGWEQLTGVKMLAHYGLTEGGHITLARGGPDEDVGRPLDDVEVRTGDDDSIEVRRLAPGRPYQVIGQDLAADGWCDTGDTGFLDENGNLHITGRADHRMNVGERRSTRLR